MLKTSDSTKNHPFKTIFFWPFLNISPFSIKISGPLSWILTCLSHFQIPGILVPWHSLWDYFLRLYSLWLPNTLSSITSGNIIEYLWWKPPILILDIPLQYLNYIPSHLMNCIKMSQQEQKWSLGFFPLNLDKNKLNVLYSKVKAFPFHKFSLNLRYLLPPNCWQIKK